jgi:hypothetical protein
MIFVLSIALSGSAFSEAVEKIEGRRRVNGGVTSLLSRHTSTYFRYRDFHHEIALRAGI